MPLYVVLTEDGNGESEIVTVWLVVNEDESSIKQMVALFKKYNEYWKKTLVIMTDKDFVERRVFRNKLPHAKLLICLFHVLRSLRREFSSEKVGITAAERYMVLEIVQKMAYAATETEYSELYQELNQTKLNSVIEYFNSNWHSIRKECMGEWPKK